MRQTFIMASNCCRATRRIFRNRSQIRCFVTEANDPTRKNEYDVVVVGGGIVGVATAREFQTRHKNIRMAVVEKEPKLAYHQTGHNSGVIHAGIYYKPGSLKAKLCVEGMHLMYKYLDEKKIPYKKVGKLVVATDAIEVQRLDDLYGRAQQNNVEGIKVIAGKEIQEIEPYCRGLKAIWSPNTGIVDFALVTNQYGNDFKEQGGDMYLKFKVNQFRETKDPNYPVAIVAEDGREIKAKYVLTCGGLQSDKLAVMSGCKPSPKIVPFRGEYLLLDKKKTNLIKGNIYPVPDPRFPFLGVHFTPRMNGDVWLGPNAVLAFKREGYTWSDINLKELLESVSYSGFFKLASKFATAGLEEMMKSIFIGMQVKQLQRFVPDVTVADVKRGPAGVRAQALDEFGNLVDDFVFDMGDGPLGCRILHCRNAPSPGATSSLAIAKMVADKLESNFQI